MSEPQRSKRHGPTPMEFAFWKKAKHFASENRLRRAGPF